MWGPAAEKQRGGRMEGGVVAPLVGHGASRGDLLCQSLGKGQRDKICRAKYNKINKIKWSKNRME